MFDLFELLINCSTFPKIKKQLSLNSFFLSRVFTVRDIEFSQFSAQTMQEYWLIAELSTPDIGERKYDGTVGRKLGVGK